MEQRMTWSHLLSMNGKRVCSIHADHKGDKLTKLALTNPDVNFVSDQLQPMTSSLVWHGSLIQGEQATNDLQRLRPQLLQCIVTLLLGHLRI